MTIGADLAEMNETAAIYRAEMSKPCATRGCDRPLFSDGLCQSCYQKKRKVERKKKTKAELKSRTKELAARKRERERKKLGLHDTTTVDDALGALEG